MLHNNTWCYCATPLYSLWGDFCYPLSVFFKLRIKPQFYCQKTDKHWTFGHRKSDLKDCSSRSLKDIKIYTLQDNGCCTTTLGIIPTLLQYSPTPYFQCVFLSFQAFLRAFFYVVFYLSSLVLQKVLQLLQRNDTTRF